MKALKAAVFLALAVLAASWAGAIPVIKHAPVATAERGRPLGVRATVNDAAARVTSVSLYYTTSRGTTPFRAPMSSSGAGFWYGSVPGHLVGPGDELYYYIQAENADGETRETDWVTVRVVAPSAGDAATMPSAGDVAARSRAAAVPAGAAPRPAAPAVAASNAPAKPDQSKKYWVTAGIIAGGAVAVGGAIALASGGGGGGKGGGDGGGSGSGEVADGTYSGTYTLAFTPEDTSLPATYDSGVVSVYVKGGSVEVVGLWSSEILSGSLSGSLFSVAKNVGARGGMPAGYLTASGQISGSKCTGSLTGTSTDASNPGTFSGSFSAASH